MTAMWKRHVPASRACAGAATASAVMLAPDVAWVGFATVLNSALIRLKPDEASRCLTRTRSEGM